jgi:hypothetical protein
MQLPSVDVFIGLFFLFGVAYSFIFNREKIVTTLCSVYVGIVIAGSFSQTIFDFFNGNKVVANQLWIRGNASTSTIAIILLLASVILISGAIKVGKKGEESSMLDVLLYGTLSVALILSSVMGFLPEATRNHYIEISQVAKYLHNWHTLFVVLPPIILIIMNFRKKDK